MDMWNSLDPYRFANFYVFNNPLRPYFLEIYRNYRRFYGRPERGTTRVTFLSEWWVYKIPLSMRGIQANENELFYYENRIGGSCEIPMARCELAYITGQGWPIIRMERVTHADDIPDNQEGWWNWVDGRQVGYTAAGELVAYDYA